MRCVDCKAKFKSKELESTRNRCPSCGHAVAANPTTDGISDGKIAHLVKQLSDSNAAPVFPEHLAYALMQRAQPPALGWVGGGIMFLVLWSVLQAILDQSVWSSFIGAAVVASIIRSVWKPKTKLDYAPALELARRFLQVNQSPTASESGANKLDATLGQHCRSVMLTNNARFAEFLADAEFPIRYATPVIGPKLAELERYPGLIERIGTDGGVRVIVVTDFTPAGRAFAANLPEPFNAHPNVAHAGFKRAHAEQLKNVARNSADFPGGKSSKARALPALELFALAPAAMILVMADSLQSLAMSVPVAEAGSAASYSYDSE